MEISGQMHFSSEIEMNLLLS